MDVHLTRLRRKLEQARLYSAITNVRGIGYRLEEEG